jgi:hypothetical protein
MQVEDFDTWKRNFDESEQIRIDYGYTGHHINQAEDDPNTLAVYLGVGNLSKAKEYVTSDVLRERMQAAGVVGAPEVMWVKPLRENVVWDRTLPAMIISHRVEDADAWLTAYDEATELQKTHGIVGHAANQSLDDPSLIIVYHQAESFEALRDFMALDELRMKMKEAGVTSAPEVTYQLGGWAKQYG